MFTPTRTRRDVRRDRRQAAADRRIGHELAWWYFWQPKLTVAAVLVSVVVGARWVWLNVNHDLMAGVGGAAGLVLVATYLTWWLREHSAYGSPSRYRRNTRTSVMHLVGFGGALLVAAAVSMWATGV